jgi:hypothetical protein
MAIWAAGDKFTFAEIKESFANLFEYFKYQLNDNFK